MNIMCSAVSDRGNRAREAGRERVRKIVKTEKEKWRERMRVGSGKIFRIHSDHQSPLEFQIR